MYQQEHGWDIYINSQSQPFRDTWQVLCCSYIQYHNSGTIMPESGMQSLAHNASAGYTHVHDHEESVFVCVVHVLLLLQKIT